MPDEDETEEDEELLALISDEPALLEVVVEDADELAVRIEDVDPLNFTLEEADELGVTISEQQGLRGPRGLRGIQGAPGTAGVLLKLARAPLSAGSVVRLDGTAHCIQASALNPQDALCAIGLAVYAVSAAGAEVEILTRGEHRDDAWSFTPMRAVFLSGTGLLTQAPGDDLAFLRVVGFAITSTTVFIDPQLPVFRYEGGM